MTIRRLHVVKIGSSTYIDGITSTPLADGVETGRPLADGELDPLFASTVGLRPRAAFTTRSIKSALTAIGFTGYAGAFVAYEPLIGAGGAKSSSSASIWTLATALVLPRSLAVSGRGNAEMSFEAIGYSADGSNPLAKTSGSLAGTATQDELFGLGPVVVNGTTLDGIQSIGIDFGIVEVEEDSDGGPAPKGVHIMARVPVIRVTTIKTAEAQAAVTAGGVAISGVTTVALRARASGATFVANGTASHVKATFGAGMVIPISSDGDPRLLTFEIRPIKGVAASIVLALGTTL